MGVCYFFKTPTVATTPKRDEDNTLLDFPGIVAIVRTICMQYPIYMDLGS